MIAEEPSTLAVRAGISTEKAQKLLENMTTKGLVFKVRKDGKPDSYMAGQFIVGIWELQVGRLTPKPQGDGGIYAHGSKCGRLAKNSPDEGYSHK